MLGSPVDLALVFGIALIVFGPKKLPELGKSVGMGIANFKSALHQTAAEAVGGSEKDASGSIAAVPAALPALLTTSDKSHRPVLPVLPTPVPLPAERSLTRLQ